jgi:hypothetical protein
MQRLKRVCRSQKRNRTQYPMTNGSVLGSVMLICVFRGILHPDNHRPLAKASTRNRDLFSKLLSWLDPIGLGCRARMERNKHSLPRNTVRQLQAGENPYKDARRRLFNGRQIEGRSRSSTAGRHSPMTVGPARCRDGTNIVQESRARGKNGPGAARAARSRPSQSGKRPGSNGGRSL